MNDLNVYERAIIGALSGVFTMNVLAALLTESWLLMALIAASAIAGAAGTALYGWKG